MRNGRAIGVAGVDIELSEIQEMVTAIRPFGTGNAALYSPNGMVVAVTDTNKLGRNLQDVSRDLYGDQMGNLVTALTGGTELNETMDSKEHNTRMILGNQSVFCRRQHLALGGRQIKTVLENAAQEITGGMNEMSAGADQINIAVNRVNDLTVANREKIGILMQEVSKFKVK